MISLIDDPDEKVYLQVRDKIKSFGEQIIPQLEDYWELNNYGHLFQHRVENLIHHIQFDSVHDQLKDWVANGCEDLLEGTLLVARYHYPDMSELEVKNQVLKLRQDIWLEINDNLTALEKTKVINHVLFDLYGFKGNKQNYHAPQNSYINNVIESRKGNPLALSILYIVLAQSLDIPIRGVNLPSHFILAYMDEFDILKYLQDSGFEGNDAPGVLFYINPFSQGSILHKTEIDSFLKHLKIPQKDEFYLPCDNLAVVRRLLHNLIYSYHRLGYEDKIMELKILLSALGEDPNAESPIV